MRVVKRIPVGAGLGGGSADAAAVLRWAGLTDPDVAMKLGSDVPFCVVGRAGPGSWRRGRVGASCLREAVVRVARAAARLEHGRGLCGLGRAPSRAAAHGDQPPDNGNDLEEAALAVTPALADWRDVFENVTGRRPRLAGSGSTWFIEGDARDVGVEGRRFLVHDGVQAALVPVRTVPSGV